MANFVSIFSRKKSFKLVTENFTTILHFKKEICHLELTLQDSSPNFILTIVSEIASDFWGRPKSLPSRCAKERRHEIMLSPRGIHQGMQARASSGGVEPTLVGCQSGRQFFHH